MNTSKKNFSKFNVGTEAEAKEIVKQAIRKRKIIGSIGNNKGKIGTLGQKSFDVLLDAGRVVGARGESSIFLAFDELGNIWTVFPKY